MTMPLILHVVFVCQLLFFCEVESRHPSLSKTASVTHPMLTSLEHFLIDNNREMFTCMYVCRLLPRQHIKMLLVCLSYGGVA